MPSFDAAGLRGAEQGRAPRRAEPRPSFGRCSQSGDKAATDHGALAIKIISQFAIPGMNFGCGLQRLNSGFRFPRGEGYDP